MTRESQLVFEIWDAVRDFISVSKRLDVAESILKSVSDFGFEADDLADIIDEDNDLAEAYETVFPDDIEEEIEDYDE